MRAWSIALLIAGLFGPLAGTLAAEESRTVELATPRPVGYGEAVQLQVIADVWRRWEAQ